MKTQRSSGKTKKGAVRPSQSSQRKLLRAADTRAVLGAGPGTGAPPAKVSSKWAWHHRVLLTLRARQQADCRELSRDSTQPYETHSMDMADAASDEFDHDLALTQLAAEANALREIDDALKRIRSGTYGICEETGRAIPAERLKAIPWARFLQEVEARLERRGMVPQPHLGQVASVRGPAVRSLETIEPAGEETEEEGVANDESLWHLSTLAGGRSPERRAARQRGGKTRKEGETQP